MLPQVLGEDQDVIKVNCHLAFGNEVTEDVIHHPLEGGGRVHESKEHHGGFGESLICMESCFLFVPLPNLDIVISPSDIKFHEVFGSAKLVDKL